MVGYTVILQKTTEKMYDLYQLNWSIQLFFKLLLDNIEILLALIFPQASLKNRYSGTVFGNRYNEINLLTVYSYRGWETLVDPNS